MRKQKLHPRTAIINTKQKNLAKKARHEALAWLARTFPQAFDRSTRIQPLKPGIMADILAYAEQNATGISKSKLREGVVLFTRSIDYLTALKAREMRIDLHGNPTQYVTDEEAEHAASKIKKWIEKSIKNAAHHANPQKAQSEHEPYCSSKERTASARVQTHAVPQAKAAPVVVKHKTTRAYDPEAVARLREKLGLTKKE